jgi:CCR4-NOT transcription complex subunit 3
MTDYPSMPLFDQRHMFAKLPEDTLFFIFYYQAETNQQLLAAKELKNKNWQYHTKYLTWFKQIDGKQSDKGV